jgi:hypothetical protein
MTAVEWLIDKITFSDMSVTDAIEQAKKMEKYNAIVEAKKYYLKGFEDAELTENQGCSHEQTMRDAETQFELVYPIKNNTMNKQTAVEWLFEQLYLSQGYGNTIEMLEQAKEMEKEQIINTYRDGRSDQQSEKPSRFYNRMAEQYYNETFKSE